jgi:hypothetical protein
MSRVPEERRVSWGRDGGELATGQTIVQVQVPRATVTVQVQGDRLISSDIIIGVNREPRRVQVHGGRNTVTLDGAVMDVNGTASGLLKPALATKAVHDR